MSLVYGIFFESGYAMSSANLSETAFLEALENLVSPAEKSPPQELLPLIKHFWAAPDIASAIKTLSIADDPRLPPGLLEIASSYIDDGPELLLQEHPNFATAVVLTTIWLTKLRNPRLQKPAAGTMKARELREWAEMLLPVARYLEPAFDPTNEARKYSEVLEYLKDVHWVQRWVEKEDLAQNITRYIVKAMDPDTGSIPRPTYQDWRKAGVRFLYQAVRTVMEGVPITASTSPIKALLSDAIIEDWEERNRQSVTPPEIAGLSTRPATIASLTHFPPLPRLRIERQPLADISAALRHPHYRAIILYGGAGMGKTTLAGQVVRAPEIQAAFPGGIAWASGAGSVEEIAAAWGTDLHFKREGHSSWTQCWRQQGADTGKMLLVLDDVVTLPDLKGLFEGVDPNAVVLLTTQFGQEIWEAVARNWLEPELIWGIQIGPFSPAEARALVEQAQRRPLTDEEWEVVANLELLSEGDPQYLGRVALHSNLAEWQALLAELRVAPEALHSSIQRVRTQWERLEHTPFRAYTETLAACMLEPRPFGTLYAAAVWRVTPEIAARRLEEQARLGLVQALEFHDPMGLIPKLWHLPKPVQGCIALTAPPSFNPDPDRRRRQGAARQRAKLARALLHYAGPAWRAPWQFQLLGIPWMLAAVLWEPWGWLWRWAGTALGPRAPRNWRSLWQRWWLAGAENARVETFKQHGAHVPLEYQCLTDAASDIGNVFLRGAALIFVGFVVLALYGLSLAPASRGAFFNSAGFQYTWLVLLLGLSLWSFTRITHIFWLLYRMGLDYPPLHWLARAARRLGMREPARV